MPGPALSILAIALMSAPAEQDAPAAGALVLFDGKTLDGWKPTPFFKAGPVKVEDGAIVMEMSANMSGITCTRDGLPRSNYELAYEARRVAGKDFFAAATFPVGASHITLVNGGWGGNVTGLSSLDGVDASENETMQYVPFDNGTWYRFRIRVTDEAIRVWVDDRQIIRVDHKGRQVGTRIETRPSRPLGFATWETGGAVRKLTIRPLTPAEVEAVNTPQPDPES